jgi:UDP-N-acetylmuramyl pentapeptide phosphotransferase/UDP-N-acetylglucosamine-1-phosphate transferase
MTPLFITASVAFTVSLAGAFIWAKTGPRIGFVDSPGSRSSHTNPTPRGGGVGIVLAVPFAVWAGFPSELQMPPFLLVSFITTLALAGLSFFDDFRPLSAKIRLLAHVVLASIVVASLEPFTKIDLPGLTVPIASAVAVVLAVGWLLATINITNFMDGIDGIAGTQAVCTGLAWFVLGTQAEDALTATLGLSVTFSAAGFLVMNWHPAKVFLGDVGSAYLGLIFGAFPLIYLKQGNQTNGIAVFSALAVWPFLADGFFTLFQRLSRRENVFQPHRTHLYQRLVVAGWSHAKASILYAAWGVCSVLLGFLYLKQDSFTRALVLFIAASTLPIVIRLVKNVEEKANA